MSETSPVFGAATKAFNYDTPTGSAHPRQTRHHHRQKRNPTQKPSLNQYKLLKKIN